MYTLKEFKEKFDPFLDLYLDKKLAQFTANTSDPFLKEISLHSQNLIMESGKRVRPYIAYTMYKAAGGRQTDKAIQFFISLEILHMFLLIHDDFMDKASLRHNVITEHEFVTSKLKKLKRIGDLEHVGNSQAVLIGDLFFNWAMQIVDYNQDFPTENLTKVKQIFSKTLEEVFLGQMIDVDLTTQSNPDIKLIGEKTMLKTAGYSFIRPMQIGAYLGSLKQPFDNFIHEFGKLIGFTFQLQDDYLDIMGDPSLMHKNILGDVAQGEPTFFTNYVLNFGKAHEKKYLESVLGKELSDKERIKVKQVFISSGAISKGEELIKENVENAKRIVDEENIEDEYKTEIYNLINLLENRKN